MEKQELDEETKKLIREEVKKMRVEIKEELKLEILKLELENDIEKEKKIIEELDKDLEALEKKYWVFTFLFKKLFVKNNK